MTVNEKVATGKQLVKAYYYFSYPHYFNSKQISEDKAVRITEVLLYDFLVLRPI